MRHRNTRRLIRVFAGVSAVCQDKHTLGNDRLKKKNVYDQALGGCLRGDDTNIITLDLEKLILVLRARFVHIT